jgi:hypothetical protein
MKPTPAEVLAALQNYSKGMRTPGSRVWDALQHVRHSKEKPARKLAFHVLWRGHHNTEEARCGCRQV